MANNLEPRSQRDKSGAAFSFQVFEAYQNHLQTSATSSGWFEGLSDFSQSGHVRRPFDRHDLNDARKRRNYGLSTGPLDFGAKLETSTEHEKEVPITEQQNLGRHPHTAQLEWHPCQRGRFASPIVVALQVIEKETDFED
jgi:hypothetical protein